MVKELLSFVVAIPCLVFPGCASSDNDEPKESSASFSNHSHSNDLFPETKFPAIEFVATKRTEPQSVEQAIGSLDAIKQLYDWQNIPEALNRDLTAESAYQYARAWKLLNDQIPFDVQWLKELKSDNVPGVDNISVQQIENTRKQQLDWLENRLPKQLADSAKYTRQFIAGNVEPMMWNHIQRFADTDMSNQTAVRNNFGRPELNDQRAEQIRKVDESYAAAILFDELMNIDSDWESKRKEFRSIVGKYQTKLESASEAILPPQDVGNSELAEIAKKVLSDPKYKLPEAVRIIVNTQKKSHGKDHYTIDFGERSIEKSPYRWEEFQVATIEKDGNQHYLWYNTIINYSVGPHTVPTKKWVLGPRHKSAPISQNNINK